MQLLKRRPALPGSYLRRMLLTLAVLMLMVVLFTAFAQYFVAEKTVLQIQQDANRRIMDQIDYNTSSMNEIVKHLAISLFVDREVNLLLSGRFENPFETSPMVSKLDHVAGSSPFLTYIAAYNGTTDKLYVGGTSSQYPYREAVEAIRSLLTAGVSLPRMSFIPLHLKTEARDDLFAMAMYEADKGGHRLEKALIFLIKPEWLLDNVRRINESGASSEGFTIVLDDLGNVLNDIPEGLKPDDVKLAVLSRIAANPKDMDSFVWGEGRDKRIVSYVSANGKRWKVVSVQSYAEVFSKFERMKTMTYVISFVCVLLAIAVSAVASYNLYRPVGELIRFIRHSRTDSSAMAEQSRDDIGFVADSFRSLAREMDLIKRDKDSQKTHLKLYFIRKLLSDSHLMKREEFVRIADNSGLRIAAEGSYMAGVLRIDAYRSLQAALAPEALELYKFAISNISSEMLNRKWLAEVVDMRSDHLAFIICSPDGKLEADGPLEDSMLELQAVVESYYKVTVSAAFSGPVDDYARLAGCYEDALQNSTYRLVLGHRALILPGFAAARKDGTAAIPEELERRFVQGLRAAQPEQVEETLEQMMRHLAEMNIDDILVQLHQLVVTIKQAWKEANLNRLQPVEAEELHSLNRKLMEKETLEEMKQLLLQQLQELFRRQRQMEPDKSSLLVDTVKGIVAEQYMDMGLNLQGIASRMKMSAVYVGKVFRQSAGLSVNEYINDIRLEHARESLERTNATVAEIMESVGYANQSQFFKHFKMKFGTTPREYRFKRSWG